MKKATTLSLLSLIIILVILIGAMIFAACGRPMSKEPWETAPLAKDEINLTQLENIMDMRIDRVRFYSGVMDEPRFFIAMYPKNITNIDDVFILNHGWKDRPEYLISNLNAPEIYSKLLADGKIRPAYIIMPDVRFDEYYRKNSEKFPFPQYLTLVAEEVAEAVSKQYGIKFDPEKWHIGGFSFGGIVSLDIARRYNGRFGSASIISGFGDPDWSYWPEETPDPGYLDEKGRGKHTVAIPGPIPKIQMACGTDDRLYEQMLALHEKFEKLGLEHIWLTGSGGHTWGYWKTTLEPMLLFHLGK